jgi:hypothetical protein
MFRRKDKAIAKIEIPCTAEGFGVILTLYPKGKVRWSSYGGCSPFYGISFSDGEHIHPTK